MRSLNGPIQVAPGEVQTGTFFEHRIRHQYQR
jgi:hypothetical protein